jgi:hypothetical protein
MVTAHLQTKQHLVVVVYLRISISIEYQNENISLFSLFEWKQRWKYGIVTGGCCIITTYISKIDSLAMV